MEWDEGARSRPAFDPPLNSIKQVRDLEKEERGEIRK